MRYDDKGGIIFLGERITYREDSVDYLREERNLSRKI
jgi:hypothetical protein